MTNGSANVVIVAHRPKPGKDADLLQLAREHLPVLRGEGLATDMAKIVVQAGDGTVVEIFEWAAGGAQRAHQNPTVRALWERYWAVCDIVKPADLPEAAQMFASFTHLEL